MKLDEACPQRLPRAVGTWHIQGCVISAHMYPLKLRWSELMHLLLRYSMFGVSQHHLGWNWNEVRWSGMKWLILSQFCSDRAETWRVWVFKYFQLNCIYSVAVLPVIVQEMQLELLFRLTIGDKVGWSLSVETTKGCGNMTYTGLCHRH